MNATYKPQQFKIYPNTNYWTTAGHMAAAARAHSAINAANEALSEAMSLVDEKVQSWNKKQSGYQHAKMVCEAANRNIKSATQAVNFLTVRFLENVK